MRGVQDEGSLVAVAGHRHAAYLVQLGLASMAHRGRAGSGVAAADGTSVRGVVVPGSPVDAYGDRTLDSLPGSVAIGRLTGAPEVGGRTGGMVEIHEPVVRSWRGGRMAVASAGRLTNGDNLRAELLEAGGVLASASDAELIAAMIAARPGRTFVNQVLAALHDLRGAYSIVVASEDRLIVARDRQGFRPLVVGLVGGATVVATEDVVLRDLGAEDMRLVEPGEMLVVDATGSASLRPFFPKRRAASLMDVVALARDDARVDGLPVFSVRLALGRGIAEERPAPSASIIVGLPESLTVAAGYAEARSRPIRPLLVPGSGGQPGGAPADIDDSGVNAPLRASSVRGQEVVLVVPLLVSGHRARQAVAALRRAGARRVHLRVASPPVLHPDPYGLSVPPEEMLVAVANPTPESLADALGVDSAAFLSLARLRQAITTWEEGWCDTVWSGEHPTPPDEAPGQLGLFTEPARA